MYGETCSDCHYRFLHLGLSPRVRGNLDIAEGWLEPEGSIPACTGKPGSLSRCQTMLQVYPRVYGETAGNIAAGTAIEGLSPRVRGNP